MNTTLVWGVILLLLPWNLTATKVDGDGKCRVLSIEGAGDHGAWEAGVISGIINATMNATDYRWDVIVGISAGSLNAGGMAQFAYGDEKNASDFIIDVWEKVRRAEIYKPWPFPWLLDGFFEQKGLVNNSALP